MSVKMSEYKLDDMNNFGHVCKHLVKFIKKTWNMKDVKPIGNKEFEEKALENFTGPDTSSAGANSCEIRLTKDDVTFSEEHGHDPVETLISSCIAYGMKIEQERQRRVHIFNTNEQALYFKNTWLPILASEYVSEDRREEFVKESFDAYCTATEHNYTNLDGFRYNFRFYEVAKWEGNYEGFQKYEDEEREKISKITDQFIKEFKENKLSENSDSKKDN